MTARGGSPRAKRASASRRRAGHAYEPGRSRSRGPRTRARCASIARLRRRVRHPAADHTAPRLAAKSRPARRVMNPTLRCPGQSQTNTPWARCTCSRPPSPGPPQIAHMGSFP